MKTIWFYFIFYYRNSLYINTYGDERLCYKLLIKLFIQTESTSYGAQE